MRYRILWTRIFGLLQASFSNVSVSALMRWTAVLAPSSYNAMSFCTRITPSWMHENQAEPNKEGLNKIKCSSWSSIVAKSLTISHGQHCGRVQNASSSQETITIVAIPSNERNTTAKAHSTETKREKHWQQLSWCIRSDHTHSFHGRNCKVCVVQLLTLRPCKPNNGWSTKNALDTSWRWTNSIPPILSTPQKQWFSKGCRKNK